MVVLERVGEAGSDPVALVPVKSRRKSVPPD